MKTGIPYADETVNAVVGCTHSGMPGCDNCWSRELHTMRHEAFLAGRKVAKQYAKPFCELQFFPERIDAVLSWRKPRTIFWCSGSDMFHEDVPDDYIFKMIKAMTFASWHTHLILTKRIERAAKLMTPERLLIETGQQWLDESIWPGISCSTQSDLDRMAPLFFQIPAAHYWLSLEPLLEDLDLWSPRYELPEGGKGSVFAWGEGVNWVVVGCESGPKRRPCKLDWLRSVARQVKEADVKLFVKQVEIDGKVVSDPKDFPKDLQIRELPK